MSIHTFEELIQRTTVSGGLCLELILDGGTYRYSTTAIHEPTAFWEPRIVDLPWTRRGCSLENGTIEFSPLIVTLDNADGVITDLLDNERLQGRAANIYLKLLDDDDTWVTGPLYSGTITTRNGRIRDCVRVELQLDLATGAYLSRNLQNTVTNDVFTTAHADSYGKAMPIALGNNTTTNGAVKGIIIDTTDNAEKILFAQGAAFSIDNVYRLRSGAWTTLTLTTHYTVTKYARDSKGRVYAYVTLTSTAAYADGDQYYANMKGIPAPETGYATLTGTQYFTATAANTPNVPGRTGVTDAMATRAKLYLDADYYIDLDGSSEYMTLAHHADVAFTGDFRIELLFNRRTSSTYNYLWFKTTGGAEGVAVLLSGTEGMNIYVGGVANYISLPANSFPLNTWHHIGISYDESEAEVSVWNLFTGAQIARGNNTTQTGCTKTGTLPTNLTDGGATLSIGRNVFGGTYFDGMLGKVAAWNAEYDTGTAHGAADAGVAAYWNFSNNLNDSSANGHTLTGTGIDGTDYGSTSAESAIAGVWAASGTYSWLAKAEPGGLLKLYLSSDGTTIYSATATTTTLSPATVYDVCLSYRGGTLAPFVTIDDTEQTLSTSGTLPSALYASSAVMSLGAAGDGRFPLSGRIYGAEIANEAFSDADGVLEGIVAEYWLGIGAVSSVIEDLVGTGDLTVTGTPAYTAPTGVETNPAWMLDRLLRWKWYGWQVPGWAVNRTSITELAAKAVTNSWTGDQYYRGCIPTEWGQVADSASLLQSLLTPIGCGMAVDRDGRLTVVNIDYTESEDASGAVLVSQPMGDFKVGTTVETSPVELVTHANLRYGQTHQASPYIGSALAYNQALADDIGTTYETQLDLPFCGTLDAAKMAARRHLLVRSGGLRTLQMEVAGLHGLLLDVGDLCRITLPGVGYDEKTHRVQRITDNVRELSPKLELVSLGDTYGAIAFSAEDSSEIFASVDTYVNAGATGTAYGTDTSVQHGTYVSFQEPLGVDRRACWRFAIPSVTTIKAATLQFYCIEYINKSQFQLRELESTTWDGASTWNAFDGSGGWSDGNIGATQLAPYLSPSSGSFASFSLNSSGIAYLQSVIGGNAEFTHQDMNAGEVITLASVDHATTAWRPRLFLTYIS